MRDENKNKVETITIVHWLEKKNPKITHTTNVIIFSKLLHGLMVENVAMYM